MTPMLAIVGRLVQHDRGQDLLEYGVLMMLIAIVAMAAVKTLGQTIDTLFWQTIASSF
jgi:Flp pilus assembly pilin Flp